MSVSSNANEFLKKLISDESFRSAMKNCRSESEMQETLSKAGMGGFQNDELTEAAESAKDTISGVLHALNKLSESGELADEDLEKVAGGECKDRGCTNVECSDVDCRKVDSSYKG